MGNEAKPSRLSIVDTHSAFGLVCRVCLRLCGGTEFRAAGCASPRGLCNGKAGVAEPGVGCASNRRSALCHGRRRVSTLVVGGKIPASQSARETVCRS